LVFLFWVSLLLARRSPLVGCHSCLGWFLANRVFGSVADGATGFVALMLGYRCWRDGPRGGGRFIGPSIRGKEDFFLFDDGRAWEHL
jgi:hypothetical protein